METGAFAMFDALGIKGIWQKHDPDQIVRKFESISRRIRSLVDREFGGPGHPNTKHVDNFVKTVRLGFVSDTVVVGFANKEEQHPVFTIMMAARYAGEVVRVALEPPASWAYRGVITYGAFAISNGGTFFVGPAVDEAAANHEQVDAALIWLGPSATVEMGKATRADFQGAMTTRAHEIPLKAERSYRSHVASPFAIASTPDEAQAVAHALLATFDVTKPGVADKRRNTELFLQEHLKEHAAIWRDNQALIERLGMQ